MTSPSGLPKWTGEFGIREWIMENGATCVRAFIPFTLEPLYYTS